MVTALWNLLGTLFQDPSYTNSSGDGWLVKGRVFINLDFNHNTLLVYGSNDRDVRVHLHKCYVVGRGMLAYSGYRKVSTLLDKSSTIAIKILEQKHMQITHTKRWYC